MMEEMRERDRICDDHRHRDHLHTVLKQNAAHALGLNLEALPRFVPRMPPVLRRATPCDTRLDQTHKRP